MKLTAKEQAMLDGRDGRAAQKAMEILAALGTIYGAEQMVPVSSVQVAGVSYDNLGEAGLHFLTEMADGGSQVRVQTTLNPAGMDVENWQALGISPDFAENQQRVILAFARMGVNTTCSCTPYLFGIVPGMGEHIAWAESSAVCYVNSVLGARTNREGGPSALAAALTGLTPLYGFHLDQSRRPQITVEVQARLEDTTAFGALGKLVGQRIESDRRKPVVYLRGIPGATVEQLKSFSASLATYGGAAMFHMEGITPEAAQYPPPAEAYSVAQADLDVLAAAMSDAVLDEVDFVSLGCPHLSLQEIARIAELLEGRLVQREFWITTARPVKQMADRLGYTHVIEASGAKFAADTCCVVAPIRGRFHALATDSAKACYYAYSKNRFKTLLQPFDEVVRSALLPRVPQPQLAVRQEDCDEISRT
jgi:predicted aconitase